MIYAVIAGIALLFVFSIALLAGQVPMGTVEFPFIVPLVMFACIGGVYAVTDRRW